MKNGVLCLVILALFGVSCETTPPVEAAPPETVITQPPEVLEPTVIPEQTPVEETLEYIFDPDSISQEVFETTKADIQQLVMDLNRIIRANNYNAWLTYLSDEYRVMINSKEFLDNIKERFPVFRNRLNTARDYFTYVVVPSRANDQVDDIEFTSEDEVTAYTLDSNRQRLILYHLKYIEGNWKITQ